MSPLFTTQSVVLFQGDSITDAGRNSDEVSDLGSGYAMMAASWFSALYPELKVRFLNRGVSGDRVPDLDFRWQKDCLDLTPNWISILVGINDTWRSYDSGDPTSTQDFEERYRALLERTRVSLDVRLILGEPFLLPVMPGQALWREDLDPKIDVVRRLAREFDAILIPYDGIFAQAATRREPAFWAYDGVHPTPAGHALMAQSWLRAVRAL